MKSKLLHHYMERIDSLAQLSHAKRKKVGAIVITPNGATFDGINGTFPGHSNVCEEEITVWIGDTPEKALRTLDAVYHAEQSALAKMLNEGVSAKGSILLVTTSPCFECCKWIARAGIREVVYKEEYRDTAGLDFLKRCNVSVVKYIPINEEV